MWKLGTNIACIFNILRVTLLFDIKVDMYSDGLTQNRHKEVLNNSKDYYSSNKSCEQKLQITHDYRYRSAFFRYYLMEIEVKSYTIGEDKCYPNRCCDHMPS